MPSSIVSPHRRHLTLRSSKQRPIPSGNQKTAAKTPVDETFVLAMPNANQWSETSESRQWDKTKIKSPTHPASHISSQEHVHPAVNISSQGGLGVTAMRYVAVLSGVHSCIS
jgi:hypothetical protein